MIRASLRLFKDASRESPSSILSPQSILQLPELFRNGCRFLHYSKTLSVDLPPNSFFDCVADVDQYSTFVPYCTMSKVVWRSPDGTSMLADMGIGFVSFKERYRSRVAMQKDPPSFMITAAAIDSSLFAFMDSKWDIRGKDPFHCDIHFCIDMQPASKLHALAMNFVFQDVATQQLKAFVRRCRSIVKPVISEVTTDEFDFRASIRDIMSLIPRTGSVSGEFSRELFDFYSKLVRRYQKDSFNFDNFLEITRDIARNEDIDLMHRYTFLTISEDEEVASCFWELMCPKESEVMSKRDVLVSLYFLTNDCLLDRTCFCLFQMFKKDIKHVADFASATRKVFTLQLSMLRHLLPRLIVRAVRSSSADFKYSQETAHLIGAYGTMEDMLQVLEMGLEHVVKSARLDCGEQVLTISTWMKFLSQNSDRIRNVSVKEFMSHLMMTLSLVNDVRR